MEYPERKIGLIINPVAGIGGRAGFKGSDSVENQKLALEAGYEKTAVKRAAVCLRQLQKMKGFCFLALEGQMGGEVLSDLELPWKSIGRSADVTTREDTLAAVHRMEASGADLIVFCGGDGTARDICTACGDRIPVLGIPAGVKMYSGCFAVTPQAAGNLLRDYIQGKHCTTVMREVMDLDEEYLGQYSVCGRLYGYLSVLNAGARLQGAKAASNVNPGETEALIRVLKEQMKPDTLHIIGPGSTTYRLKKEIQDRGTLIGVDVFRNGELILEDADEKNLLSLLRQYPDAQIIVTCIGGAGFLFGRGNQQISPAVIRSVGKENIRIAVTKSKLLSLNLRPMCVDTGDSELDRELAGYYRIRLSCGEETVYRVQEVN